MSPVKRYAEGTDVTTDRSQAELTGILRKHGVLRQGWVSEPEGDILQFELAGRSYRISIGKPTAEEIRLRDSNQYVYPHNVDWRSKVDQEWRRRWRATVLLLKAKLEFAEGDDSAVVRELMPYAVTRDGRTLEEVLMADGDSLLLSAGAK